MSDSTFQFKSENFVLFDDIKDMEVPLVSGDWIAILQCERGKFNTTLNGKQYVLGVNDVLLCSPRTIIEQSMMSPDFKGRIICISERLGRDIFPYSAKIWQQAFYMSRQCMITLPDEFVTEMNIDWEYLKHCIVERDNAYYMDMMRCLIQAMLYRISYRLDSLIQMPEREDNPDALQSKDFIARSFFDLVAQTTPTPRSVAWYADKLHKTPKYLSMVVKQTSGYPALEWIQRAATVEIADLLKNSPKSVKEICDELDFPSLSFFCRYVREHLGVSPMEYRRQKQQPGAQS